jgi:hypothetical protein
MTVFYQQNKIDFERIGVEANVPNNDVARLMYYLRCVCTSINCNNDPDIQRFTNYNNWSYLSNTEQKALLVFCYTFSPDEFNDRVFFHSDVLCGERTNEFYTINQVRHQLVVAESIVIAGQVRVVNQIMTYKMEWMRTYYIDPMRRLVASLGTSSQSITYRPTYTPTVVRQSYRDTSSSGCTTGRICCAICCCVFIIPGIIGIIISIVNATTKY